MAVEEFRGLVVRRVQESLPNLTEAQAEECVNRAQEYFLSCTKRQKMPTTAFYLWIDMAVRVAAITPGAESSGTVTSIKRGDTTVQYSDIADAMTDIQSRVQQYKVVRLV